jgi:serine protease
VLLLAGCQASDKASESADFGDAGRIVVDFQDGVTKAEMDSFETGWNVDVEFNSILGKTTGVALSQGAVAAQDQARVLTAIRQHPRVEAAEALLQYQASWVPDDPRFDEQWNLQMIGMPRAWELLEGKGTVVAVIDTGIAFEDHGAFKLVPDLSGARFVPGYDFVNDDEHPSDDNGHGTHVAGTIAQVTNNGRGVAGIAFKASLMPIKVLDASGFGNTADIAEAIRWAADHGADVINLSLGGGRKSSVLGLAVDYARRKGVVVVAAAGNGGGACGESCTVHYPAAYKGVIAVSAVGPAGDLTGYSSWGDQIDLAAPGGDLDQGPQGGILQNTIDPMDPSQDRYAHLQGTSMASPHVAGVAALVRSAGLRDPDLVAATLFQTATDAGPEGKDPQYGHGILNAAAAATMALTWRSPRTLLWRVAGLLLLATGFIWLVGRTGMATWRVATPGFVAGALVAGLGLFFLRGLSATPALGWLAQLVSLPMVDWERWFFETARPSPLAYSALVPVAVAMAVSPAHLLRRSAAGVCVGYGSVLAVAAVLGQPAVFLLGSGGVARGWLAINAVVSLGAAWFLVRLIRERKR